MCSAREDLTSRAVIRDEALRLFAADGRCKFGDARADGFVRSDGVVLVALKTLDRALADSDRIYAVILGSAMNNDGRGGGYLGRPSVSGQTQVLRKAFEQAGVKVVVDPFSLQYLEGAQIDFIDSLMGGGFTVVNPNAVKSCACGQSFETSFDSGAAKPCH